MLERFKDSHFAEVLDAKGCAVIPGLLLSFVHIGSVDPLPSFVTPGSCIKCRLVVNFIVPSAAKARKDDDAIYNNP